MDEDARRRRDRFGKPLIIRGASYRTEREEFMGRGDKRTFKGKVFKGSHGNTRLRKAKKKARAKK
jgi:ribosomal small subunit protein bTHX